MAETQTPGKDWVTPVAIALGAGGLGVGLFLFLKKPPGVDPGDTVRAHFKFEYEGEAGDFKLLTRFGYHRLSGLLTWFDPEEGLAYSNDINLDGPGTYEFDVDCELPDDLPTRTYDAEGSVLTPAMQIGQEWILRVFKDKAITVRKQ